jgi:conjugative relaxase-like TrwC/TraI family protein
MFNCTRIGSVEYYVAVKDQADSDCRELTKSGDKIAYYADNGSGESAGVWWTPKSALLTNDPTSLFANCVNAEVVNERVLRDLAAGKHPITKKPIIQATRDARVVGYDVQISAPKSFSILVAFSSQSVRQDLLKVHDQAFSAAMQWAFDEGLIVTRRGKGGAHSEPVGACTAAVYRHLTSRSGDMQVHSHGILVNACLRGDSSSGTLDNLKLLKYGSAIAAIYRGQLSRILRETHNIRCVRRGRNLEIAAVPDDVIANFSKRRAMIESAAVALGVDTANDRATAQILSYQTRPSKNVVPSIDVLQDRWQRELHTLGWNGSAIWLAVQAASSCAADHDRADQALDLAESALVELSKEKSVFEHRIAIRYVAEAIQTISSGPEMAAETFAELQRSGLLVKISEQGDEDLYSTRRTVELERSMLRSAAETQNQARLFTAEMIDEALAAFPNLRSEQRDAVRHALNSDRICVVEGIAGSGKSAAMEIVTRLAKANHAEVWTIAPSWKAVDAIRSATKVATEMARAVRGFVRRLESGQIVLTGRAIIILDEGSMVDTQDMAILIRHTQTAGKLIVVGDTSQFSAVTAGAPMAALARLLGSFRLNEVQRQSIPWQRSATADFANGNPTRAAEAYDKAGAIAWKNTRDETLNALVADYVADRIARPAQSQMVIAAWHVDVAELNRLIRDASLKQSWITKTDYKIVAYPRYGDVAIQLELAIGDVLIFGESIEVDGILIRNADTGKLVDVQGHYADPIATIELANGKRVVSKFSRLIGFRKDRELSVPKIQHAYAVTCYSGQGATVDNSYVAYLRAMGTESIYVAMTRHRKSVNLYVDQGRLKQQSDSRAAKHIKTNKIGLDLPESGWPHADPINGDPKIDFFKEICRVERKANVIDFVPQLHEWIYRSGAKILPFSARSSVSGVDVKSRMDNRMAGPLYRPPGKIKVKLAGDNYKVAREELGSFLRPHLLGTIKNTRSSLNATAHRESNDVVASIFERFLALAKKYAAKLLGERRKGWMEFSRQNQIARHPEPYVSEKDKAKLGAAARQPHIRNVSTELRSVNADVAYPRSIKRHAKLPQPR